MKVSAIQCPKCLDIIYSRAGHDYHSCCCEAVTIDGGQNYVRISWVNDIECPAVQEIEIDATPKELYDDWNYQRNQFGTIKEYLNVYYNQKTDELLIRQPMGMCSLTYILIGEL